MLKFDIKFDSKKLLLKLKNIASEKVLDDIGERLLENIKGRIPVDTGKTRDSLVLQKPSKLIRLILARDKKSKRILSYLHKGTKKHWVGPRKKKALHWVSDGNDYFSKGHYVRGIRAMKLMQITKKDLMDIRSILKKSMGKY